VTSNLYSAAFQKNDITEIETIGCSESVGFIITKICKVFYMFDVLTMRVNAFAVILMINVSILLADTLQMLW